MFKETLLTEGDQPTIVSCTLKTEVTSEGITDPDPSDNEVKKEFFRIHVKNPKVLADKV